MIPAKKLIRAIYVLIAVVLVSAIASGCTPAGGNTETDSPWNWMQSLITADVATATVRNNSTSGCYILSVSDTAELVTLLNALEKSDFTENKEAANPNPEYGLVFVCEGVSYSINQTDVSFGSLEISYANKQWWINSEELRSFISAFAESSEQTLLIKTEVDSSIPQAVIDFAAEYAMTQLLYYTNELGYNIAEAKIIAIAPINTGTSGIDSGINMYLLEYRFLAVNPDEITLVGDMQLDGDYITEWGSSGQPYLLLHWQLSNADTIWERICVTDTKTVAQTYGTAEMLDKYGDMYTASAMELYSQYCSSATPKN